MAHYHVLRGSIEEHAESAADDQFPFSVHIPGDTGARGESFLSEL